MKAKTVYESNGTAVKLVCSADFSTLHVVLSRYCALGPDASLMKNCSCAPVCIERVLR